MYVGWIPNVSGQLSFGQIGGMPIRNRTSTESIFPKTQSAGTYRPAISLLQKRNLSDRPTIGKLRILTRKGNLQFLLQAEQKPRKGGLYCMAGTIYCAPEEHASGIKNLHQRAEAENLIDPHVDPSSADIANLLAAREQSTFALSFSLDEDGVVQLKSLVNASPSDPEGTLKAFEAYSFLKDVLHRHRFHSESDDSLLGLAECTISEHEIWADFVTRNLHRSVISSFRSQTLTSQADGLGKLAYLESFEKILERRNLQSTSRLSTSTLRNALDAHHLRKTCEQASRNFAWTYVLASMAFAIPIVFVCLQLLQLPCISKLNHSKEQCSAAFEVNDNLIELAKLVMQNLHIITLTAVLIVPLLVLTAISHTRLADYSSYKLKASGLISDATDFFLRMAVSRRNETVAALLVLAAAIAATAFYMIKQLLATP